MNISNLSSNDIKELLEIVEWAVRFTSYRHSPDCREDNLCDGNGVCPHVHFNKTLKEEYNKFCEKVEYKV